MIIKWRLLGYRFTFTIAKTIMAVGANSRLNKNEHILMWDFDNVGLNYVKSALLAIQKQWWLPQIRIFQTSKGPKYQAWCYKRCMWKRALRIIANTDYVDMGFLRYGCFREHFTLRTSTKNHMKPKLVATLESNVPEDCNEFDLMSWTKYETLA